MLNNRSTLEQFRAPYFATGADEQGWSMGKLNNFKEVFGEKASTWFLPISTTIGDGLTFPTRIIINGNGSSNPTGTTYQSISNHHSNNVLASPAANAVRGRAKDISFIDEEIAMTTMATTNNGIKHHTEVVMDPDERIQVKVSKLPQDTKNKKHDLMQLQ